MGKDVQIDKLSKQYVILSSREIKYAKYLHRRAMRRIRKNINKPNPQYNHYSGWIG